MSLTGFNLRRRKLAKKVEPVISEPKVVEEKVEEVKTETTEPSATKSVHKKTKK